MAAGGSIAGLLLGMLLCESQLFFCIVHNSVLGRHWGRETPFDG